MRLHPGQREDIVLTSRPILRDNSGLDEVLYVCSSVLWIMFLALQPVLSVVMRPFLASLVLSVITATLAAPSKTTARIVHERRATDPGPEWILTHRLNPIARLPSPLRIGLKQSNLHHLENLLLSVSHPESPSYGQHWTPQQISDYFAASDETVDAVRGWLGDNGIEAGRLKMSKSKGWIEVGGATVGEVEELLGAEYYVFEHESGVEQISAYQFLSSYRRLSYTDLTCLYHAGCDSYSVPEHIREHIDLIKPTVHFNHASITPSTRNLSKRGLVNLGMPSMDPGPKTNGKKITAAPQAGVANCDEMITLDCLRALYSIDYTPVVTDKNSFGIGKQVLSSYSVSMPADCKFENSRAYASSVLGWRSRCLLQ